MARYRFVCMHLLYMLLVGRANLHNMNGWCAVTADNERSVDYSAEKVNVRERAFVGAFSGWMMLGGMLLLIAFMGILALSGAFGRMFPLPLVVTGVTCFFLLGGFFVINPNEGTVLQ